MNEIAKAKDTFERIEQYYHNDATLTAKEKEIAERYELTFALLQRHRNKKIVVSKMISLEKSKGRSISVAQVYRDIKTTENLFVPIVKYSKELMRHVLIESSQNDLKRIEERLSQKDLSDKAFVQLMSVKDRVIKTLVDITGIGDDDADLPDFSKLEVHQYNIGIPEPAMAMFNKMMEKGVVDITQFTKHEAVDADFQEIYDDLDAKKD